jgi:hypothetical protein
MIIFFRRLGGKDSLVVWQMMQEAKEKVLLVYVADGLSEYESHRRLSKIVALTESPVQLVKHDFAYEEIEEHAKSYCIPCGHPWAALVMFDNVLVCLTILCFLSLANVFGVYRWQGSMIFLVSQLDMRNQPMKGMEYL